MPPPRAALASAQDGAVIRLLVLVQKPEGLAPNQRFRHEQWARFLARTHGIELTFAPFESPELTGVLYARGRRLRKALLVTRDAFRRWRGRWSALEHDGVVVVREAALIGGAWFERWLARAGVPFIYDFDDAIWQWTPSERNGVMNVVRAPWKVRAICRLARCVTVGNAYLAAFARRYNPNVHVVRTSIDLERYPTMPEPPPGGPFTVVWTGSHSTLPHLLSIAGTLRELSRRMPLRLRVICDVAPVGLDGVDVEFVPWRADGEAADLAAAHVGIMPLPDTAFTRGKCGCKALQYMAIGRAVVVSPVGINTEIVEDGVNGLTARTADDWAGALGRLAADPALRARLGKAGRATVQDGFTAEQAAGQFARAARTAFSPRPFTPAEA